MKNFIATADIGMKAYQGPKRTDFLSYDSRLQSYTSQWPSEKVEQKPSELSEAGFFYCGKN